MLLFNAYTIGLDRANAYMKGALRSMMEISAFADMKNLKIGDVWYNIGKYQYNLIDASVSELMERLSGDATDVMFPDAVLLIGNHVMYEDVEKLARDNKLDIIKLHDDGSLTIDTHYTNDAIRDVEGLSLNRGRVGFNNPFCKTKNAEIRAIAYLLNCNIHDAMETTCLCYSLKTADGNHFVFGHTMDPDDPLTLDEWCSWNYYYTERDLNHALNGKHVEEHRPQKIERIIANDILGPQWYTCDCQLASYETEIDNRWSMLSDVVQICNRKHMITDRLFKAIHTSN